MTKTETAGYLQSGLPYNRFGHGPRPLVIFQGLFFENKPQAARMSSMYHFLGEVYTVYAVMRRPGLPQGYTLTDMADDYAAMISQEFGKPVDVLGVSTGGSIAQIFAADHPDLLRKLVIHSAAHSLSENAKRLQWRLAELARAGRWQEANALTLDAVLPPHGIADAARGPLAALASRIMTALDKPADANDLLVTIAAEDVFDFKSRLGEIAAPTLVIAGDEDPFYTPELFRETAAGIPNARLILYEGQGHGPAGEQFARDVIGFLRD
jgi:pimeloyl-ACP methyl ester carboxylesterase